MTHAPSRDDGAGENTNQILHIGKDGADGKSLPQTTDTSNKKPDAITQPLHRPDLAGIVKQLGIGAPAYACFSAQTPNGWRDWGADWPAMLADFAARPLAAASGIYLASGAFRAGSIKKNKGRTTENVERVLWLGTDCDACTLLAAERAPTATARDLVALAKQTKNELHAADDDALGVILDRLGDVMMRARETAGLPEPTAIVQSGYGRYYWWGVAADAGASVEMCVAAAREMIRRFNASAMETLGAPYIALSDAVFDAGTRVFRLPGTFNLKNPVRPRACRWLDGGTGRPLTLAEMKELGTAKSVPPPAVVKRSAPLEIVPTRSFERGGKADGCYACGRELQHGYRHGCGAADCVVCAACGAPAKWCPNPDLPPAGDVPPLPPELDREAAETAGTATTEPLATVMARGLLAYEPALFDIIDGPAAVVAAHAYFSQPARPWAIGTEYAPHPLDPIFAGWREDESWLAVMIAKPGGYKSALAMHAAYSVAVHRREPVLYVGYEDSIHRRMLRLLANRVRLPLRDATFAATVPMAQQRLNDAAALLADELDSLRLLCGQRALTPVGIAHAARMVADAHAAIPLVVIDALQNVAPLTVERDRRREIDAIMAAIEWIRDHTPARILLLSQAARGGEGYDASMGGAKESSGIEYAGDVVMALRPRSINDGEQPALLRLNVANEKNRAGEQPITIAVEPRHGVFRWWTDADQRRENAFDDALEAERAATPPRKRKAGRR